MHRAFYWSDFVKRLIINEHLQPRPLIVLNLESTSPSFEPPPSPVLGDCLTVEQWKQAAEESVQDPHCVLRRNHAITISYAKLYLKHPKLYKWAAMAAFASHHVRLVLQPFAAAVGGSAIQEGSRRLKNTQIIKEINDAIFDDIYWAHLVYDGSKNGLQRLTQVIGNDPAYSGMLNGFRQLEQARLKLETSPNSIEAEELVWQANTELLRHEQRSMVQPRFDRLAPGFSRALSLFATMHYQFGGRCRSALLPGSFLTYMFFWRKNKLDGFPNITNFKHRWEWIHEGILPGFRCYENTTTAITRDLQKLISKKNLT